METQLKARSNSPFFEPQHWSYDNNHYFNFHPDLFEELNKINRPYTKHINYITIVSKHDELTYYKIFQSTPIIRVTPPYYNDCAKQYKESRNTKRVYHRQGDARREAYIQLLLNLV